MLENQPHFFFFYIAIDSSFITHIKSLEISLFSVPNLCPKRLGLQSIFDKISVPVEMGWNPVMDKRLIFNRGFSLHSPVVNRSGFVLLIHWTQ